MALLVQTGKAPVPTTQQQVALLLREKSNIEKCPDIRTHEMGWYISCGSVLVPAAASRSNSKVKFCMPAPQSCAMLHTHPMEGAKLPSYPALMSSEDVAGWLNCSRFGGLRFFHIATIGFDGKVMGFSSYAGDEKFFALGGGSSDSPYYAYFLDRIISSIKRQTGFSDKKTIVGHFIRHGFFTETITPADGYAYDEEVASFRPAGGQNGAKPGAFK